MTDQEQRPEEAQLSESELRELKEKLYDRLDIRDRKYGLPPRTYEKCFVGEEGVQTLIREGIANDEDDAVRIGNLLLNAGIFHHVQRAHAFKNEYLFYRFACDEDHGRSAQKNDGSRVSWADFLPLGEPSAESLQPRVPERDPNLGEFPREELEAIGVSPLDDLNTKLLDNTHPVAWKNPRPASKYNLVVVGGGTGGLVTAAAAAGLGARVALIEAHLLGGDCLNVGCVPSKALLRAARAAATARNLSNFGLRVPGEVSVDFAAVMQRLRKIRAGISPHDSAERFAGLGVDVFLGRGKFTGPNQIEINEDTLEFSKAVIATGGTAAIPKISGLKESPYLTNASVFNLTRRPGRLGVIGAGPIGIELAQAFQRLGSQVTVFSRSGEILPKEEPEAAELVEQQMRREGVQFEFHVEYRRVEGRDPDSPVRIVVERDGEELVFEFDRLLVATGRKPSVENLGLEAAGIDFDLRNGVKVNDRLQTSNSSIYAVGDVATQYQFTHVADFMARLVVRNALFFGRETFSGLLIPWCTYTDPEVAHVGLYQRDLQERNIGYVTYSRDLSEVDRAIIEGDTDGFVKILVRKGKDEILGATIVGPHAGDLISEISIAMKAGMGLGRLANVIHPYPTTAEAIRQCGDAYNRDRLTPTVRAILSRLMSLQR